MDIKRNPQIGSTDWLLRMNDGTALSFPTEQEARRAMATIEASEKPIEIELASKITGEILPGMRKLFATMSAMQIDWQDNGMGDIIAQAAAVQHPVAGFAPEVWAQWGATFTAWQAWMETENEQLAGETPRSVLMRRYVAQVPS